MPLTPLPGFSWLVQETVAGMPQPGARTPLEDDLAFLAEQGVAVLVSANLVGVDPVTAAAFGLDHAHFPVEDFQAPSLAQMRDFAVLAGMRADAGQAVGVHCTAGLGRTGTFLAVWLVSNGWEPAEAILEVRRVRPGSIETFSQEEAIYAFAVAWSQAG